MLHVGDTVTMQPIYSSALRWLTWKFLTLVEEKFICFPTPGLFAWRVIWPLLWPVLYWGAQMIPRELSWQHSVVYSILQDYIQSFPVLPSKCIDFSSRSFSTEGFGRVTPERAKAKLLHFCEHSLLKTERWNICLRNQMQMKTTVFTPLTHKKEELGLQIFLIRKWSNSAFIYGGLFAKPSKHKGRGGGGGARETEGGKDQGEISCAWREDINKGVSYSGEP